MNAEHEHHGSGIQRTGPPGTPRFSPVETTLAVIGGKWKPLIVYFLLGNPRRFNELRRLIPGVTQRMLTKHLREMEADGVVVRTVYSDGPPRVDYSLSPLGRSLQSVLDPMVEWGTKYLNALEGRRQESSRLQERPSQSSDDGKKNS